MTNIDYRSKTSIDNKAACKLHSFTVETNNKIWQHRLINNYQKNKSKKSLAITNNKFKFSKNLIW